MASYWIRDASKCSAQGDGRSFTAREGYIIGGGINPVAIAANPTQFLGGEDGNTPLPAINSPHPNYPAAILDGYSVETDGGISFIIGLYSTDRRFRLPSLPAVSGSRPNSDFVPYTFALPYAVKSTQVFWPRLADGQTGPPIPEVRHPWTYLTQNHAVRAQRFAINGRIAAERMTTVYDTVFDLGNTAMAIDGRLWLFEGARTSDAPDSGDFQVSMSFVREKDLRVDYVALPPETYWPYLAGTFPGFTNALSAKPSFHKTIIIPPASGNPEEFPTFRAIPTVEFVQDGYDRLRSLFT